jgi:hypothetical protein
MVKRSDGLAWTGQQIAARPEDVTVTYGTQLFREMGGYYTDQRHWLNANSSQDLRQALVIADRHHFRTAGIVIASDAITLPPLSGWRQTDVTRYDNKFYRHVRVITLEREP